jgi:predicted  nucleic acid-binding Zn-ribbon protein
MSSLALLQELQTTLDLLRTIERDLSAFPPELAKVDAEAKALQAQADKARVALESVEKPRAQFQAVYDQAKKIEVSTRAHLKDTQHQIPYAEALRELGKKERAVTAAAKPLKELDVQLAARHAEVDAIEPKLAEAKAKFEADHAAFLALHENQVVAKTQLGAKQADLWTKIEAPLKPRVERLIAQRQGKLVASVEGGVCGGCHTKLRGPLVTQLRHPEGLITCETCQRYLYLP